MYVIFLLYAVVNFFEEMEFFVTKHTYPYISIDIINYPAPYTKPKVETTGNNNECPFCRSTSRRKKISKCTG